MIYYFLFFVIVLCLMHEKQKSVSNFFHLSDGHSQDVYDKMRKNGVSGERLKDFVLMENDLLGLEQKAVQTGIPYSHQGNAISKKIKATFPNYNFSYHGIHLKQLAEPNKTINRKLKQ